MKEWVPFTAINNELVQRIMDKKKKLETKLPLPQTSLKSIRDEQAIEWTYHSNSLDGNALSLKDTRVLLTEGLVVGGKSFAAHLETYNHHNAIMWLESVVNDDFLIQLTDIMELNQKLVQHTPFGDAAEFRSDFPQSVSADVQVPAASRVSELVNELLEWLNAEAIYLDAVTLAAVFYHRMVWIHPFLKSSSQTTILAMNLILMRLGYPAAVLLRHDTAKFKEALIRANVGDFEKLYLLIAQAMERSLDKILAASGAGDAGFFALAQLVKEIEIPYDQEYLSLLARRGKLEAFKEGRVWYSSKAAIKRYMDSE